MEITIDDFTFSLLSKYQARYLLVQINSYNHKTRTSKIFWVYPSKSEVGLWRCMIQVGTQDPYIGNRQIYKGKNDKPFSEFTEDNYYDYIQQTFIHLTLQQFLNEHVGDLPEFDISKNDFLKTESDPRRNDIFMACYMYQAEDDPRFKQFQKFRNIETQNEVIATVDDYRRQIKEPPFIRLQQSIECGEKVSTTPRMRTPTQAIKEFSRELKKIYNYDEDTSVFTYNNIFSEILEITGEVRCTRLSKKRPTYGQANIILLYYLKSYIHPIGEPPEIYKRNIERIASKEEHYMPFLLTTPSASINEFGMYTHYIPCGAFICKLFDYSTSVNDQCTREEVETGKCTGTYSYIGSRYDRIFPFTMESPEPETVLAIEPDAKPVLEPVAKPVFKGQPEGFGLTEEEFEELYANGKSRRRKRRFHRNSANTRVIRRRRPRNSHITIFAPRRRP